MAANIGDGVYIEPWLERGSEVGFALTLSGDRARIVITEETLKRLLHWYLEQLPPDE